MADLFNQQISATYSGLLKTTSNGVLSSSLAQITDGRGNGSQLYLSTSKINFYNAYEFPTLDGSANQVLKTDGSGVLTWANDISGTVTSVALSVPTGLTVTGSPITTSGTIAIGGTLGVANGGTGATTLTGILVGNGTSDISVVTDGTTSGQVLSTDGNGTYSFIDAGTGDVTVDGASVGNRVAVWNNTTGELRATSAIATENSNIYLVQPSTNGTDKFNYIIGGAFAINENDFGTQNTGFGHAVLNGADLTGGNNSSFGMQSQTALTTGSDNTSIGSFAMYDNRSGDYNVGLGAKTMFNQRISNKNVSIGYDSMDGVSASQTAESNNNVAIGYESLHIIEGGDNNTVLGYQSGSAITTGSKNVIIGSNTGSTIATSSNNIIISDGSGNNRIQVDSGGNVGIANDDPKVKLHIIDPNQNGSITDTIPSWWGQVIERSYSSGASSSALGLIGGTLANGAGGYLYLGFSDDVDNNYIGIDSNNMKFGVAGSPRLTISSGGAATFTSSLSNQFIINSTEANGGYIRLQRNGTDLAWIGSAYHTISPVGANTDLAINSLSGNIIFASGSSEKMRISSGGEATFGGGSSTNRVIQLQRGTQGSDSSMVITYGSPYLSIGGAEFRSGNNTIQTIGFGYHAGTGKQPAEIGFETTNTGGGTKGDLVFATRNGTTVSDVPTEKMRISSGGLATFSNGIQFGTGATLNAYEESTWTPNVQSTAGGAYTISNARGKYIKVGKHVTVQFYFIVSSVNGGTGAKIINLPFATKSGAAGDNYIGNSWNTSNGQLSSAVAAQNGTIAIIYVYSGGNPIGQGQGNTGTITYISQS